MMRRTIALFSLMIAGSLIAQSPRVIEAQFEFYRNQVIVQVKINGKGPFSMLLDTGTDPSTIDLATAREIGLKLPERGHAVSGGGTSSNPGYETNLSTVTLGDLTAGNVDAIALDLSKLSAELGRPVHGVLGHSLLNGRTVQIDYPKHVIRFYDRPLLASIGKQPPSPNRTVLRFRYDDKILLDDTFVNGRKVTGSVDTGSTDAFQLTPTAVTVLGLEAQAISGQRAPSVGYNGVSENTRGRVESVQIGTLSFSSPEVTFFPKGAGHDKEVWGLNIGNGLFKDFVLTIDYRSRIITLERP